MKQFFFAAAALIGLGGTGNAATIVLSDNFNTETPGYNVTGLTNWLSTGSGGVDLIPPSAGRSTPTRATGASWTSPARPARAS